MIRVVLDTNIIVSALLRPLGPPAQALQLATGGAIQPCLSGSIYAEYEEVLRRPKFGFDEQTIEDALAALRRQALWVRPADAAQACADPDDDMFLECATAANADYLVTGNWKHFPPSWGEVRVLSARAFLDIVTGELSR